jgi:hypothetical protein
MADTQRIFVTLPVCTSNDTKMVQFGEGMRKILKNFGNKYMFGDGRSYPSYLVKNSPILIHLVTSLPLITTVDVDR